MAGPLPRKKMYKHLVRQLLADGFFDNWRATNEICSAVNKDVPHRWTPLYPSSVFRYVRELPLEERYIWNYRFNSMIREWKISEK
ncbi:MAG: hypothetical protein CMF55_00480 [Legionellales bacterium]|nr:hypothetical protein [Legionellales bacterium]